MMWLSSLLILMTVGGTFCSDYYDDDDVDGDQSCFFRKMNKCSERIRPPAGFPQTAEDLLAACKLFARMESCILEETKGCNDVDSYMTHLLQTGLDYLQSTCQEDNPTFKVIASNLPCIERASKSREGNCRRRFSKENLEAIDTEIELLIGEDYGTELSHCLFGLMEVACEGVTFGYHCGEEVAKAVEEIEAHMVSPNALECKSEHLEELSPFLRVFEGLLIEEMELENAIEGKRK